MVFKTINNKALTRLNVKKFINNNNIYSTYSYVFYQPGLPGEGFVSQNVLIQCTYPCFPNKETVVPPTGMAFLGPYTSQIVKQTWALRGRSGYLIGNLSHSFQLQKERYLIFMLNFDPLSTDWIKYKSNLFHSVLVLLEPCQLLCLTNNNECLCVMVLWHILCLCCGLKIFFLEE